MNNNTYSVSISDFLEFLRNVQTEYSMQSAVQKECDNDIQDFMHILENEKLTYHEYAAASKELKKIRTERRDAKNIIETAYPIIQFIGENKKLINSLEQLLGKVRKLENNQKSRIYSCRGVRVQEVLNNVFNRPTKKTS